MDIKELCREAADLQIEKGWPSRLFGEDIALMHSELSEALEHYRDGRSFTETFYFAVDAHLKPDGIPIEFADVVIRIAAFCGANGINLAKAIREKMDYNATRPERHGGKKI